MSRPHSRIGTRTYLAAELHIRLTLRHISIRSSGIIEIIARIARAILAGLISDGHSKSIKGKSTVNLISCSKSNLNTPVSVLAFIYRQLTTRFIDMTCMSIPLGFKANLLHCPIAATFRKRPLFLRSYGT